MPSARQRMCASARDQAARKAADPGGRVHPSVGPIHRRRSYGVRSRCIRVSMSRCHLDDHRRAWRSGWTNSVSANDRDSTHRVLAGVGIRAPAHGEQQKSLGR